MINIMDSNRKYNRHSIALLSLILAFIFVLLQSNTAAFALNANKELIYRVKFGGASDVEFLLSRGGNPNGTDESGLPLVSIAASRMDGKAIPILEKLINAGADINAGGWSNQYPIVIAVRNGDVELATFLLKNGADYNVRDNNGMLVADIARHNGVDEVIELIEELEHQKELEYQKKYGKDNFDRLWEGLVYNRCMYEYFNQYEKFRMIQDDTDLERVTNYKTKYKENMISNASELVALFNTPSDIIARSQKFVTKTLSAQFKELISNRYRRKHGIGKEEDAETRCAKIQKLWFSKDLFLRDMRKTAARMKWQITGSDEGAGVGGAVNSN